MTQSLQLLNFDNAVRYFIEKYCKKTQKSAVTSFRYLNNKRYAFVTFNQTKLCLVLFRRDFFHKFGDIFQNEGESGLGETINTDILKLAIARGVTKAYYVYEKGMIYSIDIKDIPLKGHKRETFAEGKPVYSFSIKHLERFE